MQLAENAKWMTDRAPGDDGAQRYEPYPFLAYNQQKAALSVTNNTFLEQLGAAVIALWDELPAALRARLSQGLDGEAKPAEAPPAQTHPRTRATRDARSHRRRTAKPILSPEVPAERQA